MFRFLSRPTRPPSAFRRKGKSLHIKKGPSLEVEDPMFGHIFSWLISLSL